MCLMSVSSLNTILPSQDYTVRKGCWYRNRRIVEYRLWLHYDVQVFGQSSFRSLANPHPRDHGETFRFHDIGAKLAFQGKCTENVRVRSLVELEGTSFSPLGICDNLLFIHYFFVFFNFQNHCPVSWESNIWATLTNVHKMPTHGN